MVAGGKEGGSGVRPILKDRQQAAQRLDAEGVPAHLGPSQAAPKAAGRLPLCPASSAWPGAQALPSLGLHLPLVMGGDTLRCPCTHRFPRHGGPQDGPHSYGGNLWLDLQALFLLVFKCPLPNFPLGEGEAGEGGREGWRGFNFVSH